MPGGSEISCRTYIRNPLIDATHIYPLQGDSAVPKVVHNTIRKGDENKLLKKLVDTRNPYPKIAPTEVLINEVHHPGTVGLTLEDNEGVTQNLRCGELYYQTWVSPAGVENLEPIHHLHLDKTQEFSTDTIKKLWAVIDLLRETFGKHSEIEEKFLDLLTGRLPSASLSEDGLIVRYGNQMFARIEEKSLYLPGHSYPILAGEQTDLEGREYGSFLLWDDVTSSVVTTFPKLLIEDSRTRLKLQLEFVGFFTFDSLLMLYGVDKIVEELKDRRRHYLDVARLFSTQLAVNYVQSRF